MRMRCLARELCSLLCSEVEWKEPFVLNLRKILLAQSVSSTTGGELNKASRLWAMGHGGGWVVISFMCEPAAGEKLPQRATDTNTHI